MRVQLYTGGIVLQITVYATDLLAGSQITQHVTGIKHFLGRERTDYIVDLDIVVVNRQRKVA